MRLIISNVEKVYGMASEKHLGNYRVNVEIREDAESIARRNVEVFVETANECIHNKGTFLVAVSGGQTPRRFFELLGELPKSRNLPWHKIELFWVDERYVSPDSQHSNYKLAADTFLDKVDIPKANIHRIPTDYSDFSLAARTYEKTIRQVFHIKLGQMPQFDLVQLGMSEHGQIGSVFSNSYALLDKENLVDVVYEPEDELDRITITPPVLLAAKRIVILISGKSKSRILSEIFTSEPDEVHYPVHILWAILDRILWLMDAGAAEKLGEL